MKDSDDEQLRRGLDCTFDFALIKEPCQSLSSSSASGNLALGGKAKYHFITKEKRMRAKVVWMEGDAANISNARVSGIFAAVRWGVASVVTLDS